MRLLRIEADGLRNLEGVDLVLPEGMTLIAGRNGQGKSGSNTPVPASGERG